jgi:hypothetical protein
MTGHLWRPPEWTIDSLRRDQDAGRTYQCTYSLGGIQFIEAPSRTLRKMGS